MRHTLVISSGDPAGIGPEVTVKALADPEILEAANWIVVGEDWVLAEAARASDWAPQAVIGKLQDRPAGAKLVVWAPGAIRPQDLQVGQVSRSAGQAAVDYIRLATAACLDQERRTRSSQRRSARRPSACQESISPDTLNTSRNSWGQRTPGCCWPTTLSAWCT